MTSKRAEQRRIQMSCSMTQALFNAIRDVAHERGISNGALVEEAIKQYLQAHYPERAAEAGL